jgi:PleD family two-component response regulator
MDESVNWKFRSDTSHILGSMAEEFEMEYARNTLSARAPISREARDRKGSAVLHPIQILMIEDDPDAAELLRIGLTQDPADPIRVEWSPTISYAMTRLTESGVDAILLDLGMPELNGFMSFGAIEAAADPVIPVIIYTADESRETREAAMARGAVDYLVKGEITPRQIRQKIRQAVQSNWLI